MKLDAPSVPQKAIKLSTQVSILYEMLSNDSLTINCHNENIYEQHLLILMIKLYAYYPNTLNDLSYQFILSLEF